MSATQKQQEMIEAVVYAMVSKKTGKAYIGSSCNPERRFQTHLYGVVNGNHQLHTINEHFAGHTARDIRFEILERMTLEVYPGRRILKPMDTRPLLHRERHWMRTYPNAINRITVRVELDVEIVDKTVPQPQPQEQAAA